MKQKNRPGALGNSNNSSRQYSNSPVVQRARILKTFAIKPRLSTFELRDMGIMHPAGRVMELRRQGYRIELHWIYEPDANGVDHRLGQYVFQGRKRLQQDMEV